MLYAIQLPAIEVKLRLILEAEKFEIAEVNHFSISISAAPA